MYSYRDVRTALRCPNLALRELNRVYYRRRNGPGYNRAVTTSSQTTGTFLSSSMPAGSICSNT